MNLKHEIVTLLEDNTGERPGDLEFDDDFLDTTPKAQSMKEIISKLDFIKTKRSSLWKDAVNRMKR